MVESTLALLTFSHSALSPLVDATNINCMLITVKVLESISIAERVLGPWNSLPVSVDFTSLHRFKRSILKVDFKKFLIIKVDGYTLCLKKNKTPNSCP